MERACTGCHLPPHPDAYGREDWPGVTRKMEEYMFEKGMNVAPRDLTLVLEYLMEKGSSRSGPNPERRGQSIFRAPLSLVR